MGTSAGCGFLTAIVVNASEPLVTVAVVPAADRALGDADQVVADLLVRAAAAGGAWDAGGGLGGAGLPPLSVGGGAADPACRSRGAGEQGWGCDEKVCLQGAAGVRVSLNVQMIMCH